MLHFLRKTLLIVVAAALAVPALALPTTSDVSPPSDVVIENIIYGGTGCPRGTASVSLSSDRQSFSAIFKQFTAYMNTDSGNTINSRKFCQLNLSIRTPPGWQFTIVDTSFTGYASLSEKVTATHTSTYYFSGSSSEQSYSVPIYGPTYQNFNVRGITVIGSGQWSPCGTEALLNIKSELLLTGEGYGAIREAKGSGNLSRIYGLQWRTC
ncbi:hypothetical protein ABW19_dt0209396 [Dactylella cylindrospora]|nr:hypothetical protein ABW19_dt0209396 [Dactylella cylindrospora]